MLEIGEFGKSSGEIESAAAAEGMTHLFVRSAPSALPNRPDLGFRILTHSHDPISRAL
jgi:hypothetical protein